MTHVTHCIIDKVCDVINMYNRSSGIFLLVTVDYKKKRKFYHVFSAVLFSKEKVIVSRENLDNFSYGLPSKAGVLHCLASKCFANLGKCSLARQKLISTKHASNQF